MKRLFVVLLTAVSLTACSASAQSSASASSASTVEIDYENMFDSVEEVLEKRVELAESCCAMTNQVWYEAIHEKKYGTFNKYSAPNKNPVGFNTAISNFQAGEEYKEIKTALDDNENALKEGMKILRDAPEEYKEAFDYLLEAYTACNALQEAALTPTGSYNDYGTNYHRIIEDFKKAMQKADIYQP